jgi:transcriptional antiterminator NusG
MDDETYHVVRNTPLVTQFLGTGKVPIELDDQEAAQSLSVTENIDLPQPGERVTVKSGPLQGLTGTVVRVDKNDTLVIATEIFGRSTNVEVEANAIQRTT